MADNQFLNTLANGDYMRDYAHASDTFVSGQYRLNPKIQTLFHVFIELNPVVASVDTFNPGSNHELGMLAKTATLPKFTIQNKILNSYNRKNIVQEKINYDPLTITFHDDSSDVVRTFWQNYYNYYYRDSDHSAAMYNQPYKYSQRAEHSWGFGPKTSATDPYINSITIFSMHQKRFSSYKLIRPTILSFAHGQHSYGEYSTMEHVMSVAYEAVHYGKGSVSPSAVTGFGELHYDNTPSPLSSKGGSTRSIFGPAGLVSGADDILTNLSQGNYAGAALGAYRVGSNLKNMDLKKVAEAEIKQIGTNILKGQNTQSTVFVPTMNSIQEGLSKAITSIPGVGPASKRNNSVPNMNSQNSQTPNSNAGTAR